VKAIGKTKNAALAELMDIPVPAGSAGKSKSRYFGF
jgi:hypothetical protein